MCPGCDDPYHWYTVTLDAIISAQELEEAPSVLDALDARPIYSHEGANHLMYQVEAGSNRDEGVWLAEDEVGLGLADLLRHDRGHIPLADPYSSMQQFLQLGIPKCTGTVFTRMMI